MGKYPFFKPLSKKEFVKYFYYRVKALMEENQLDIPVRIEKVEVENQPTLLMVCDFSRINSSFKKLNPTFNLDNAYGTYLMGVQFNEILLEFVKIILYYFEKLQIKNNESSEKTSTKK